MEIGSITKVVRKRWLLFSAFALITVGLASFFAFSKSKAYDSTTTVVVLPNASSRSATVLPDQVATLVATYAQVAKSKSMLDRAAAILGRPLRATVQTGTQSGTGILNITAESAQPTDAQAAAQNVAEAFTASLQNDPLVHANIVSAAPLPTAAVQPQPPIIIGAALILAVIGGALLVVGVERVRRRVESAEDVAEFTDRPVLGTLPYARQLRRSDAVLAWETPELQGFQEALRALSVNIDFTVSDDPAALLVTSSTAGQGKSTLVANLAVALAQAGRSTLVIDADIHNPRMHKLLKVENDVGLTTLLTSGRAFEPSSAANLRLPRPTPYANLQLLPAGPVNPDARNQLQVRFKSVLTQMLGQSSIILVDSGPLLAISDVRTLAADVGRTLLVVNATRERPSDLRASLQTLALVDAPVLGVVLNSVTHQVGGAMGYGY